MVTLRKFLPGDLVTVKPGTLVQRYGSESQHYTSGYVNGMVIQLSYRSFDNDADWDTFEVSESYFVLFAGEMRIYLVNGHHLLAPDQVTDPSRLFPRLTG